MRKMWIRFWIIVLEVAWSVLEDNSDGCSVASTAGRVTHQIQAGTTELTLITRDCTQPDIYSREEIFVMLGIVRQNEQRMGWVCPEFTP